MATRMLIDATHSEETRVVVVDGNRLQEFDFESARKKQLKGNIYLAKITRVEPSLQAAFVEYGGNRDGFLPFSDIHPDYYQIPIADRQALLAQEAAAQAEGQASEDEAAERKADTASQPDDADTKPDDDAIEAALDEGEGEGEGEDDTPAGESDLAAADDAADDATDDADGDDEAAGREGRTAASTVEDVGGDALEEVTRTPPSRRAYKIQEVIKRRQIILVQVTKEERGNKGAALTTYLSLAGRYCVLMPNTARGGGISRKIVNVADRKRLKEMVGGLDVAEGMGVIVRTAGMNRNKPEIKRDFDYLTRLWDEIREATLQSSAPKLVYEEANLIKRSIRDLYNKDIKDILVEGEEGYRSAKDFIRMLMPSRAKVVQPYRDQVPLFRHFGVEEQFDALHSPTVNLKSGGYIVINPTEALVSIDVNSGRATRERNIEATALATNLEAAEELARQLRLRDLSGLIVIDFIDMDASRNNRAVERRLKDHLKSDRARLQVGRISAFGLLEMSRQRLRPSILEASGQVCSHCGGSGIVRSTESTALHVLRAIEEKCLSQRNDELTVHVASPVALYLLNIKRDALAHIEERYGLKVFVFGDDKLVPPEIRFDRQAARPGAEAEESVAEGAEGERKRKRRPRRRRRGQDDEGATAETVGAEATVDPPVEAAAEDTIEDTVEPEEERADGEGAEASTEGAPKRRRRGKRGGRRRSRGGRGANAAETATAESETAESETAPSDAETMEDAEAGAPGAAGEGTDTGADAPEVAAADKPKRSRRGGRGRTRKPKSEQPESEKGGADESAGEISADEARAGEAREEEGEVSTHDSALESIGSDEVRPEVAPPGAETGEELIVTTTEPAATGEGAESSVTADSEEEAPPSPGQGGDGSDKPETRRGWWRRAFLD